MICIDSVGREIKHSQRDKQKIKLITQGSLLIIKLKQEVLGGNWNSVF